MSEVRQNKTGKTHRVHRDYSKLNIVLVILAILANIGVIFTLFNASQFASLSKISFILVNIIALMILLIMDILVILAVRVPSRTYYVPGVILLVISLLIGSAGTYAFVRVNRNIDKITGETTQESVSTSLVVYNGEDAEKISDVGQLEGKTVGFAIGTNTGELGKNQIDSRSVNASYEEYLDYSTLLLALFNGEVDCAILPTNYVSMFQNEAGLKDLLDETASILDFEETITINNSAGADKDITKEPFTVLLIGNADGLSDTMILCSVNPISMKITMSSLARDSYVPITCYGGNSSKLNASHAVSRDCTIATIERLVGVDIDYYVDTNFQGVVDVVDALGGVVVNSPISFVGQSSSAERGHYTVYVPAGENTLNGEQALAFARERYKFATGDFARQEHQQQVIKAIMQKIMRTRDVNTFLNVLDAAGNNIQTNFTVAQMTNFFRVALQKANRYYDSEHVENIFDIQTSRVTGYSSGLWDSGVKIVLYIYRLWQGSLNATKAFIERNINMDSVPTANISRVKWSVNWGYFTRPVISADIYPEAMIPSDVPPEVLMNTEEGCQVQGKYWYDGSCHDNPREDVSEKPDLTTQEGCTIAGKYWYDNGCHDEPKPTTEPTADPEGNKEGCNANGKYWHNNKCVKHCPDGYEPDGNGGCKVIEGGGGEETPEPPSPAEQCANNGGTWDGSTCVYPPSPAEQCANNGGTWDGNTCVYPPSPAEECANNGGTWDGNGCVYPPSPAEECANNGGTWDGNGCVYPPSPAEECANNGGTWDGTSCVYNTPDPGGNEGGDTGGNDDGENTEG
ncbi:MAG: LCP family protein [Solobacterium sp.]|nr:LCP family protein [Solobacterium sp.]